MKKVFITLLTFLSLSYASVYPQAAIKLPEINVQHAAAATAIGGLAVAGYFVSSWINKYLNTYIIHEIAEAIIAACTLPASIEKMNPAEQAALLKKKAWLINIRMRILDRLAQEATKQSVSSAHLNAIAQKIATAKAAFFIIDKLRPANPYEKDYKQPSFIDGLIEKEIISSLILNTKPATELTKKDLERKKIANEKQKKVIERLAEVKLPATYMPLVQLLIAG